MGESLMERRRVQEEVLRDVNCFYLGTIRRKAGERTRGIRAC